MCENRTIFESVQSNTSGKTEIMTHNEKHREAERRRLDGEKPTKAQINQTLISRRQSKKVLEEIKQAMLPSEYK